MVFFGTFREGVFATAFFEAFAAAGVFGVAFVWVFVTAFVATLGPAFAGLVARSLGTGFAALFAGVAAAICAFDGFASRRSETGAPRGSVAADGLGTASTASGAARPSVSAAVTKVRAMKSSRGADPDRLPDVASVATDAPAIAHRKGARGTRTTGSGCMTASSAHDA